MSTQAWLRNAGERYLGRIQAEDLVFLIELEIGSAETAELLEHLGRCRALPWEPWAHACVAVAAVQVAYEAPGEERSFTRFFMKRLTQPYSQSVWEEQYGKRIEVLFQRYFPDDFRGYGAFRYVGPIYRHAGIPSIAVTRFAQFLRRLISERGPAFTRQEFESARQCVSGVASRFLSSEYGFQYARNAARILHSIDIGLILPTELASIPGYRRNFWTEVMGAVGRTERPHAQGESNAYDDPVLALAADEGRLVLRFHPAAIKANVVRLDGRPVLYTEVPTASDIAPRIEIENRQFRFERWWSPGQSPAALFRGSDGRFVADQGGVPAGEYFLAAEEQIELPGELIADELGYLAESDYRIWRVVLDPDVDLPGCNLYAAGNKPAPQIHFARSQRRHTLGVQVFEERVPDLVLRNWDEENSRRFWIFIDDGSGQRRLDVPPGTERLHISVPCPSVGAIWIEARGFFRQASALPHLPFTVLPTGITVEFPPRCTWMDDPAFATIVVPKGWRVVCRHDRTESGMWRIPPRERVLDGVLEAYDVRIPFSVRIPRIGMYLHPQTRIWWAEAAGPDRSFHVEGTPGLSCCIYLQDDRGEQPISGDLRIGQNGTVQLAALQIRDALSLRGAAGGEFALSVSNQGIYRTGWYYASAQQIRKRIETLPDSSPVFHLPRAGQVLKSIRELHTRELARLECGAISELEPIREWLAEFALCSATFDGTHLTGDVSHWARAAVKDVCEWYNNAVSCLTPGAASADVLATRPSEDLIPLDRWRLKFGREVQRLATQSDVVGLVEKWREAVRRSDGSAANELLAQRSGGRDLTEGARKYLIGMRSGGNARMRALNSAIGSFDRARQNANSPIIRAVAAGLLEVAYKHSGRSEFITDDLREEQERGGIDIRQFSPWEGDYEPVLTSTQPVDSNRAATEGH